MTTHQPMINLAPIENLGLNLDQYTGLWCVEERQFLSLLDRVSQMNLAAHIEIHGADRTAEPAARVQPAHMRKSPDTTIGIVDINGTVMKRGSSLASTSSLIQIRRSIRAAAADDQFDAILLRIDSPGGTVAGTGDVAEEVLRAREAKPVWAFAEDLMASAVYWIGSQCERIYVNHPTALIGSIGTMIGLYDYSGAAAQKGVKAVVIKTGKLKGAGFVGTEIDEDHKAYFQDLADKIQTQFTAAVATGRGKSVDFVTANWCEGRVWNAVDAVEMGLADGIQSLEQTVAQLSQRAARPPSSKRGSQAMSQSSDQPKAATIQELKAACPGATGDFIVAQMEKGATVTEAMRAHSLEQQERLQQAEQQRQAAEKRAEEAEKKAASGGDGVDALGDGGKAEGGESGADAIAEWNSRMDALTANGMTREKAVSRICRESPELRTAFVDAVNANRKPRRRD